jgi:hypothetical protein
MRDEEGPLTQEEDVVGKQLVTLKRPPTSLVWIRYQGSKHDNAAFVIQETDTDVRVQWDTTRKYQWLSKNDVIITEDSALLDRRGRQQKQKQRNNNNNNNKKSDDKEDDVAAHPKVATTTRSSSNVPVATISFQAAAHAKDPPGNNVSDEKALERNQRTMSLEASLDSDDDDKSEETCCDDNPAVDHGDDADEGDTRMPKGKKKTKPRMPKGKQTKKPTLNQQQDDDNDDQAVTEAQEDKSIDRGNKNHVVSGVPSKKLSGRKILAKKKVLPLWCDSDSSEEEEETATTSDHNVAARVENGFRKESNNNDEDEEMQTKTPQKSNKRTLRTQQLGDQNDESDQDKMPAKRSRFRASSPVDMDDTDDDTEGKDSNVELEPSATRRKNVSGETSKQAVSRKKVTKGPVWSDSSDDGDDEEEAPTGLEPGSVDHGVTNNNTGGSTEDDDDSREKDSDFEPTVTSNVETDSPAEEEEEEEYDDIQEYDDNDDSHASRPPLAGEVSVGDFVQRVSPARNAQSPDASISFPCHR